MGSSSSKFRKHLQNGDEYAAVQLYNASSDLRKGLDPNSSYGDNYNHDTPLHLAARHGMKSLLRIFLYELGGNPNKKNGRNETALHSVCMATNGRNFVVQQRRAECLMLVLQWRGAILADGEVERADLGAQDEKLNTGLHYCAASGLKRCVELLVSQSAPLFTENEQKQTPCDSAEMHGHNEIALYLESKMVFCQNEEENIEEMDNMLDQMESEEGYSGLRAQDLQEAKDQLLVETSDMLRIPLFTAEALLRNHEWSREMLLEAWMEDAVACCDKCGVIPPSTVASSGPSESNLHSDYGRQAISEQAPSPVITPPSPTETICDICTSTIGTSEEPVPMSCDHQFCRGCWERYLTGKIKEGEAHNITCPGFDCSKLVPVDVIETLVSRDMARRYLQFDIKAFVESNPNIKWCPYPGCGRAVRLPDSDNPMSPTFRGASDMSASDTSHAVDCGNGHIFCWECLGDAHEPASCDNWKIWHQKIGKVRPEECTCTLTGTEEETEVAANCLWLVTNSKSCPNCKSPIQKNEGCNHMKCSKCKHDFCWVCLEAWKKHSSATGGYFRCNRYEVVKEVEKYSDMAKADAEARNKRMQELNRFVHYYTRFRNHENSFKLEEPLLSTAKEKMVILAKAFTDPDSANLETKFVEDTVNQLLKARRVLKCSYVYGFYLEDTGYKKPIFEFMQTELEECTETLSEMIARPYLRTPRSKIIQTAHLVQRKRHEFVTAIAKGLVPPDSSPTMKKKRKKFSVELDDLDPANPWVKDPSGRHTNVSALLDWPEESDESDEEVSAPSGIASLSPRPSTRSADPAQPSGSSPGAEPSTRLACCIRKGCTKNRAQNPRTGEIHDHCSLKCMRLDQSESIGGREEPPPTTTEYFSDYQMDLLRALEMSRLQFLQEMGTLRPGSGDRSPRSPGQLSMREEQEHPPDSPAQLVLCDPPSGRQGVPVDVPVAAPGGPDRPGTSGGTHTQGGQLDQEIQQLLDMSHLTLQGEDQDLRLAIELSLQEAASKSPAADTETKTGPISSGVSSTGISGSTGVSSAGVAPPRDDALLSYNPDCSTTVTRVPNKSVEDLAAHHRYSMTSHTSGMTSHTIGMPSLTSDGGIINTNEYLGAYGGVTMETNLNRGLGTDSGLSNRRSKSYNHIVSQRGEAPDNPKSPQITAPNSFGLIKDIAVGNIIAADVDKTKNFADKDFSQVFYKKSFPGEVSYGGARGDGDARGEGEKSGPPLEDPWLRQVPRGHRPHSTGWSLPPGPPAPPHPRMYSDSVCHPRAYPDPPEEDPRADSRPLLGRQDSVDPADIVISSEVLESLLQGAERYAHISDEELELPLPPPPPPPPPAAANNNHRGDNHTDTTNSGANQPHATSNVRATNGDDNQNRRSSSDKDAVFV